MNTQPSSKDFWKLISSKVILDHPRMKVVEDMVELPNKQVVPYVKFAPGGQGVTLVCIRDNKILLQKEYSYPVNETLLQFPGGKVDKDETPAQAAVRELVEESGLEPESIEPLGWYYPNNRRSDAKMHVVLAREFTTTKKEGGDTEESIESFWMPLAEFKQMIADGKITNFAVLAAWAMYVQH